MATVLFAWELGSGFGHVRSMLPVAYRLSDEGHSPVFALKNIVECWPLMDGSGIPVVPAPQSTHRSPSGFRAGSYADILAIRGFADRRQLFPLVDAWMSLIKLSDARLVIAEHAPAACVAARGIVPTIVMGDGFTIPLDDGPTFPRFDSTVPETTSEATMLSIVQEVLRSAGRDVPSTLPDLFHPLDKFIYGYPELDPYERPELQATFGPIHAVPGRSATMPTSDFFAYLGAECPGVDHIFRALAAAGLRGSCHVRRASPKLVQMVRDLDIVLYDEPPSLAEVLPQCRFVVHHGGVGTSQDALSAGRPQLLFPLHIEMELTAKRLAGMGVARYLAGQTSVEDLHRTVRETFNDPTLAEQAEIWAKRLEERGPSRCLDRIVQRCLELLETN